ncbi:MAG: hypothetical protein K9I94_05375 [Bacteroidales bacterium]|nr:hypothetical protein [Bacteroidales bacterium]
MLNPFALFLYLQPVMEDLSKGDFVKVLFKASLISLMIFLVFFISGNYFFEGIFRISFDSFRIFGGVVIFSFAYLYIVKGQKAMIVFKEDLDDLASEIALPFMVGAGTISIAVLMGEKLEIWQGLIVLAMVAVINFLFLLMMKHFRDGIRKTKFQIAFDKNVEVLIRLNGFVLGSIGISMIVQGIKGLFAFGPYF